MVKYRKVRFDVMKFGITNNEVIISQAYSQTPKSVCTDRNAGTWKVMDFIYSIYRYEGCYKVSAEVHLPLRERGHSTVEIIEI